MRLVPCKCQILSRIDEGLCKVKASVDARRALTPIECDSCKLCNSRCLLHYSIQRDSKSMLGFAPLGEPGISH